MSDDFDKQDDDFDWLGDDDDNASSEESGLTGELSWLNDAESSPDAKKRSQTDDLDLDWLKQGDDDSAPKSGDATGVTGELSWLSDDELTDSPDAHALMEDGDWVQSDEDEPDEPEDDAPDWMQSADADDTNYESDEPLEQPHGLLDRFNTDSELTDDSESAPSSDQSPNWLVNMGQTGALSEDHLPDHPSWLNDTGTFSQEQIQRQLDAIEHDEADDGDYEMGDDADDVVSLPDEVPDWLSGASMFDNDEASDTPLEMPDIDTMFGFDDDELDDEADNLEMPDMDTMFGFDEDQLEDEGTVAEPVADGNSTDWMNQYDDDDEFGERPESVIEENGNEEDDDEPAGGDTGWLEFDDSGDDDDEPYDPYAQYGDDDDDSDEEYEDIFSTDTTVDTGMLTSQSNLFDAEQPVSAPIDHEETPDWLSGFDDDDEFGATDEPAQKQPAAQSDMEWLDDFGDDPSFGDPTADPLDDVPDWLKGDSVQPTSARDASQFEDEPDMIGDDFLADIEMADETISRVPTGLTGELQDFDDDFDLDLFDDVDDDISPASTGLTGELQDLDDDSDFNFLDDIEVDEDISPASTGLTGELSNLDDSDFDFLDDIDIDDIDFDDLELDDIDLADLTGELSNLDDATGSIKTGLTGELQDIDDEMDLSFLDDEDDDELARVPTGTTGDLQDVDDEIDLSFLDQVEIGGSGTGVTGDLQAADEELDLSFLDDEETDSEDWFGESTDFEDEGEPDWMQTLNDASDEDLVEELDLDDSDFADMLDGMDMENIDFGHDEVVAAPAANLDSLLSTFDDVEDSDFAEVEDHSQIEDLDAIFDAAMRQDELDDDEDLPENIPEWLRGVDISSDETSAAAIIRQQADRPIDDLDDRLQALREKGLSVSSQAADDLANTTAPQVLSGVSETLGTPQIAHEIGVLISDINLTGDQKKQSKLLQKIVGVTITPTVETDADGTPIVVSSRRSRRFTPNIGLGRLLVAAILVLAMILPFVSNFGVGSLPPVAFGSDNRSANAVFNQIEALNEGDWVLVGFEYGPTAAGELDSVADILLRHIFSQGAKPIIVSSNPVAIVHAQNILNEINQSIQASEITVLANQDYYIARYLTGGTLGLRDLTQNLDSIVRTDAKGNATNLTLNSLNELALMLLIAESSEDIRSWSEQITPSTTTRLVAATGYAAQPLAEPYVNQTEGILGLMVGYRDAYTYGEMLQGLYATPTPVPTETFTATFTATDIPTITDTPIATETPVPTETVDSANTDATAESSGADDGTLSPDDTTAVPSDTPEPTETPLPTNTPEPTATATALPSDTPQPTATPSPTATPKLITVIVVTAPDGSVNVRTGPGTTFNVVTTVNTGDVFQVIGENDSGAWIHFLLPDGREGWIASFLVEKTELPEADLESDDSASAGRGVTVMQVDFNRRLGKNQVRYSQQQPTETATVTGTPPTATPTFTPSATFTPTTIPTATFTPTATPDPRATFAFARDRKQEESRLKAMTLGTIAAVVIILLGNIFYGLRAMAQRRRESKR